MGSIRCEFRERLKQDKDKLIAKSDRLYDGLKLSDLEREIHGINVVLNECIRCSECGIQALYARDDECPVIISERDCPEASV